MSEHNDTTHWWERYRTDVVSGESHHIDVFFRSLAPSQGSHDTRRNILKQIEEVAKNGQLDSYDISILGEGMCLCDDCGQTRIARRMRETLERLQDGGSENVDPVGFTERTIDSQLTDEHYHLLEPPEVSLAVYIDDSLRAVLPARVDGKSVSVSEFLDELASLESSPVAPQAEA